MERRCRLHSVRTPSTDTRRRCHFGASATAYTTDSGSTNQRREITAQPGTHDIQSMVSRVRQGTRTTGTTPAGLRPQTTEPSVLCIHHTTRWTTTRSTSSHRRDYWVGHELPRATGGTNWLRRQRTPTIRAGNWQNRRSTTERRGGQPKKALVKRSRSQTRPGRPTVTRLLRTVPRPSRTLAP